MVVNIINKLMMRSGDQYGIRVTGCSSHKYDKYVLTCTYYFYALVPERPCVFLAKDSV